MKFKITSLTMDTLRSRFAKNNELAEIDLELVPDTANEAALHQQIRDTAFHKGYHYGFKEGFYQGKKLEVKYCGCGCGGNNCFMRFCDNECKLYNN